MRINSWWWTVSPVWDRSLQPWREQLFMRINRQGADAPGAKDLVDRPLFIRINDWQGASLDRRCQRAQAKLFIRINSFLPTTQHLPGC